VSEWSKMDLKGYFPMRLLNMLIGTMMPKTFDMQKKLLESIAANGGKRD
jgi:hypothetical protein